MADKAVSGAFDLTFEEQVAFFRNKINLPTEVWDDIRKAAHDRAFVVAGAMKADLLQDLREAVAKAIETGTTLETFRKDFRAIVEKHGWTGWTGEGTKGGEAWRTKVIYETNLRTSYAAGRWAQMTDPDMLKHRPFWRYVHNDSVLHPRPQHKRWGDMRLTLRYDDPFWQTHFPPNGWGCRCRVTAVTGPKAGAGTEPPAGWNARDSAGNLPGIDKGWGYAPGANAATPLRELVEGKLLNLDAPIGAAMWEQLAPALAMEQRLALTALVDAAASSMRPAGNAALAHVVAPATVADLAARGVPLETADVWLRDEELIHALRDAKGDRGAALSLQTWRDLPSLLAQADAYLDTADTALVYAFDTEDGLGKVLVRVNYRDKLRVGEKRAKVTSNFIRTGGLIEAFNVESGNQYQPLRK